MRQVRYLAIAVIAASCVVSGVGGSAATSATPVTPLHTLTVKNAAFYAVAVDSKRHRAYVTNGTNTTSTSELIDTRTGAHSDLTVGVDAESIAIDESTGLAYLPDADNATVSVLRGATLVKTIKLPTKSYPFDVTIDPVTNLVYVDEQDNVGVAVIKGTTLLTTITVGTGPQGGAVDSGNGDVYIPDSTDGMVSVIRGKSVIRTIHVGSLPEYVAVDSQRHLAYVSNSNTDTVSVIHNTSKAHAVKVGNAPFGIVINPLTGLAYVGNYGDGTVSILDGTKVKATVKVGAQPQVPAYDATNGIVLFPSRGSTEVAAILGTKVVRRLTTSLDSSAMIGVDSVTGRALVAAYNEPGIVELQTPTAGTITISRPTHRHYRLGARVTVTFRCRAGTNNSVKSCVGNGPTASGGRLATSHVGVHHFRVSLRSAYGVTLTKSVTYRVDRPKKQ